MANSTIRYGASLRKRWAEVQKEKHSRYVCDVCGKSSVKRLGTGIWKCRHCGATYAGGAYSLKTSAGQTIQRMLASR